MFEAALIKKLQADLTLTALISTYGTPARPSIFSDQAPEKAVKPYITFAIKRRRGPDELIQLFNVLIDFWATGPSVKNARAAAKRIELLLDQEILSTIDYSNIRMTFYSGGPIEDDDPRVIHQNLQFNARACRVAYAAHQHSLS
jgi:hypothetical protein